MSRTHLLLQSDSAEEKDLVAINLVTGERMSLQQLAALDGSDPAELLKMGQQFKLMQCRCAMGVVMINVCPITPEELRILRENLAKTMVDWKGLALAEFKSRYAGALPAGLDDECLAVLTERAITDFKSAMENDPLNIPITNGCCTKEDCPKRLFAYALLSVMTSPIQ